LVRTTALFFVSKYMNIDRKFKHISFNARLLLKEMQKRGIKVDYFYSKDFIKATYKKHVEILRDIYTNLITYSTGIMIDDKYYAKKLLRQLEFKVVPGNVFDNNTILDSLEYAKKIKYPVVLKPTSGSHGDSVYLDIENSKELEEKIKKFLLIKGQNEPYLIEKHYKGNEFRFFITKNNFFAAVARIPANVTGDGKNSLAGLVEIENNKRMYPRNTCLCEIRIDDVVLDFLKKNEIGIDYVPKKNEIVFLRNNSNVSTGGNCYDVTDKVHPAFVKLAKNILKKLGDIPFLGIDLICEDVTRKISDYVICELNSTPGLSLHMMPEKGISRNTAGAIVDILFPETIYEKYN
jgi:D-alanine-D-alanine ligase-like ATP-grasp enzyme